MGKEKSIPVEKKSLFVPFQTFIDVDGNIIKKTVINEKTGEVKEV